MDLIESKRIFDRVATILTIVSFILCLMMNYLPGCHRIGILRMYPRQSKSMEQGVRSIPRDNI